MSLEVSKLHPLGSLWIFLLLASFLSIQELFNTLKMWHIKLMDRDSVFENNGKWHICLFLLGLHICHCDTKKSETQLSDNVCASRPACVCLVCIATNLCFGISKSASCLSMKDVNSIFDVSPETSLSLLPQILILIKSAKWQSRSYKGKREEKLNCLQRSWKEMEVWRTLLSRANFNTRIKWTLPLLMSTCALNEVIAHFPAESIKFQEHIVDLPDLQGFHWHVLSRRSGLWTFFIWQKSEFRSWTVYFGKSDDLHCQTPAFRLILSINRLKLSSRNLAGHHSQSVLSLSLRLKVKGSVGNNFLPLGFGPQNCRRWWSLYPSSTSTSGLSISHP